MSTTRDNTVKFVIENAGKLCTVSDSEFWPTIKGTRLVIGYPIEVIGGSLDNTIAIGGTKGYFYFQKYRNVNTITWVHTDNIEYFDFVTIDRVKLVDAPQKIVLPHKCNRCKEGALIIYTTVECSNSSCLNFCSDIRL